MIGQLLIARLVVAIILGKATVFHLRLNGYREDNTKRTSLDFSFILSKKQKINATEEGRERERGAVSGG